MINSSSILSGDRRALARLLTQIENGAPEAEPALAALFPHTGRAHLIGLTGAPGTGKSSLVNELTKTLRGQNHTVAILAIDPSSPFTGGAILGDRIRMRDLAGDPGVFIRSMASRGSSGGLARATADAIKALDAAGFEKILIETVGAGQAEVDIARAAHTVLVIEAPGLGDDVQAIKAGLLEIADVFVVNKADLPGAENAARALRASLDLAHPAARTWADDKMRGHHQPTFNSTPEPVKSEKDLTGLMWNPPILQTVALEGQGITEVVEALEQHRQHLHASGELKQRERERLAYELKTRLREALFAEMLTRLGNGKLNAVVERVLARELDPASAARELAKNF